MPQNSLRANVQSLMANPVRSPSRKKAIMTLSKRRNISRNDALFVNSLAIGKRMSRKK